MSMSKQKRPRVDVEEEVVSYSSSIKVKIEKIVNNNNENNDDVRNYFGVLVGKDSTTTIESSRRYCVLCWEEEKSFSYKLTTSRTNYGYHLEGIHKVKINPKPQSTQQSKIDSVFRRIPGPTAKEKTKTSLARSLAKFAARALIPFHVFDSNAFKDLCVENGWATRADLPHSTTISGVALTKLCEEVKRDMREDLKNSLRGVDALSITSDCWSDNFVHRNYLTITAHVIDENMMLKSYSLGTFTFKGPKTGEVIAAEITLVIQDYDLSKCRITCVSDAGSDMIKAICTDMGLPRHGCLAHSLHRLIVHDFLDKSEDMDIDDLKKVIEKVKAVYRKITYQKADLQDNFRSEQERQKFNELQELAQKFDEDEEANQAMALEIAARPTENLTRFKTSSTTRWSSLFEMIKSFVENEETYRKAMEEKREYDLILTTKELSLLEDAMAVLEIFRDATTDLQGQEYATANLGLLTFLSIKKNLEDSPKTPRQRKWSRVLLKNLPERFKITDDIILAAMLDPSVCKLDIVTQFVTENKIDVLQILQRASEAQGSVEAASVSVVSQLPVFFI
ncbi:uncharacterized protein DMENIID0001_000760 [Sergentomyia squamirostris]